MALDVVTEFFNEILEFKDSGLYQFVTDAFAEFVVWSTVASIKAKLFMLSFAWDVAQQILVNLNISSMLQQAWGSLDSKMLQILTACRVPDAINIILSARVTRYVLEFLGL